MAGSLVCQNLKVLPSRGKGAWVIDTDDVGDNCLVGRWRGYVRAGGSVGGRDEIVGGPILG